MASPESSTVAGSILTDLRVTPTAYRFYMLLRDGKSFEEAARALQKSPDWLRKYERELFDLGYIEIHSVKKPGGIKERRYVFLNPEHPQSIAS